MVTRALGLAMVLAIILAVSTPALAHDLDTAKPIPGYPDYEITDKGKLIYGGDAILGKCGSTQDFLFLSKAKDEQAARACEKAEHMAPLADTGGPPIVLVPIALFVAGGLLIRKSTAL